MEEAISPEGLFNEFDRQSKEDWVKKVQSDLKAESLDGLIWQSAENIEIQPFYTPEDTKDLGYIKNYQHSFANADDPANGPRHWVNYELVEVVDSKSSNKAALDALKTGADGLLFDISNLHAPPQLDILLDQVLAEYCHVSFTSRENIVALIRDYIENLTKSGVSPKNINGFYGWDAIAAWTTGGGLEDSYFQELATLFDQTSSFPGFRPLTVSSHAFENSGAGLVQEVAFTLNTAVDYIDRLTSHGIQPEQIFNRIQFSLSVGSDFFMEIAKFRAFRILFHQIARSYGLDGFHPGEIKIHCTSSLWNKTLLDINNNMLRNTTEAMAAVIGGCDSIQLAPHDRSGQNPSPSSRRIARNISNILKDEAYLDKTVDPAAGSYYLETLTDGFAKAAWAVFREVEKEGGFVRSFKLNKIQEAIKAAREQKFSRIAKRQAIIIGVNQYPDKNESPSVTTGNGAAEEGKENHSYGLLTAHRASEQFEALKMKTLNFTQQKLDGKAPKVFIATLGGSPIQKIRVGFIGGFFASAGIDTQRPSTDYSLSQRTDEAAAADEKIVVICGSNEDYEEKALDFVRRFKEQAPDKMLWLAGAPTKNKGDLLGAGLDGFIHISSDVIATVGQIQSFLGMDKGKEVKLI